MKKLITLSLFALSSMASFAGNGEKDLMLDKFNTLMDENVLTVESQEDLNPTATYEIQVRIYICGPDNIGTDWFETATGPNGTGCIDENQLEVIKTTYENLYRIYYPEACGVGAYATKLDDC